VLSRGLIPPLAGGAEVWDSGLSALIARLRGLTDGDA